MTDANTNVTLTLTVGEVNDILNVLGQCPTSLGVYPLLMKIKSQGDTQLEPNSAAE